jgi:hypothetical protein
MSQTEYPGITTHNRRSVPTAWLEGFRKLRSLYFDKQTKRSEAFCINRTLNPKYCPAQDLFSLIFVQLANKWGFTKKKYKPVG